MCRSQVIEFAVFEFPAFKMNRTNPWILQLMLGKGLQSYFQSYLDDVKKLSVAGETFHGAAVCSLAMSI